MTSDNNGNFPELYPLLFKSRWVATDLDKDIAAVDVKGLCDEYRDLRENAPSRRRRSKEYFVDDHDGVPSTTGGTNRREEHGAIALRNLQQHWRRPNGTGFRFLDYQFPLRARQSDKGVGKVDLVGVDDDGRFILTELKVEGKSGGRGDAPPVALWEGLRYSAIVEANLNAIADEAKAKFGVELARTPPVIQILATRDWWRGWMNCRAAGDWRGELIALMDAVQQETGVSTDCLALDSFNVLYGGDGEKPRLAAKPRLTAAGMR